MTCQTFGTPMHLCRHMITQQLFFICCCIICNETSGFTWLFTGQAPAPSLQAYTLGGIRLRTARTCQSFQAAAHNSKRLLRRNSNLMWTYFANKDVFCLHMGILCISTQSRITARPVSLLAHTLKSHRQFQCI